MTCSVVVVVFLQSHNINNNHYLLCTLALPECEWWWWAVQTVRRSQGELWMNPILLLVCSSSFPSNMRLTGELKTLFQIYRSCCEGVNICLLTQVTGTNNRLVLFYGPDLPLLWKSSFCSSTLHYLPTEDEGRGRRSREENNNFLMSSNQSTCTYLHKVVKWTETTGCLDRKTHSKL